MVGQPVEMAVMTPHNCYPCYFVAVPELPFFVLVVAEVDISVEAFVVVEPVSLN